MSLGAGNFLEAERPAFQTLLALLGERGPVSQTGSTRCSEGYSAVFIHYRCSVYLLYVRVCIELLNPLAFVESAELSEWPAFASTSGRRDKQMTTPSLEYQSQVKRCIFTGSWDFPWAAHLRSHPVTPSFAAGQLMLNRAV